MKSSLAEDLGVGGCLSCNNGYRKYSKKIQEKYRNSQFTAKFSCILKRGLKNINETVILGIVYYICYYRQELTSQGNHQFIWLVGIRLQLLLILNINIS